MPSASQRRKAASAAKERQRAALVASGFRQHTFILSDEEAQFLRSMGALLGIAWTSPAERKKFPSTRGDPELLTRFADKSAGLLRSLRTDKSATPPDAAQAELF